MFRLTAHCYQWNHEKRKSVWSVNTFLSTKLGSSKYNWKGRFLHFFACPSFKSLRLTEDTLILVNVSSTDLHSTRSRVQAPLKSWIFFRLLYAIVKIAITTARIILHLISYPQFTYDLFHMHHSFTYLSREHMNPQLTCSQRQWLHSSVGKASHRYSRGYGFKPRWSPEFFFRLLYAIVKIAITTARIILHLISYPQFTYDLFHMHHSFTYLSREHMNPQLTCSQRQWLHSSVGRASHRYSRGHRFKPRWSPEFFSGFFTQL